MDVSQILQELANYNLIRLNRQRGNWYSIYCPFHSDGNEKRPSCGVLIHSEIRNGITYPEGMFHCFTCGTSLNMKTAVERILAVNKAEPKVKEHFEKLLETTLKENDYEKLIPGNVTKSVISKYGIEYNTFAKPEIEYVSEEELKKYRYTVKYMYDRKLTDEIIQKFDIGFDKDYIPPGRKNPVPCITFPVRDETGKTLFIARRSIEGKQFYLPKNINKPIYGIYELPKDTKSVIITESCFNALTCYVYGKPAIALFGTGTQLQMEKLKTLGIREFTLGLDGDDAGLKSSKKFKKVLKECAIIRTMQMPPDKDINDLTKEEFTEIYNNRI